MPKVNELSFIGANLRVRKTPAPASALSVSVAIAALSLALRDSFSTFLIVWIVSFLGLSVAWIWLETSLGPPKKVPQSKSEMGLIERMLPDYEQSVQREKVM